jgi:hypothetical protein
LRLTLLEQAPARRPAQERLVELQERVVGVLRWLARNPVVQIVTSGFLVYEVVVRLQEYVTYLRLTIKLEDLAAAVNQLDVSNQAGKVELGFGFYFWYLLIAHLAVAVIAAVGLALVIVPPLRVWGLRVVGAALLLDILFNQFSSFRYSQFKALIGFGIELVILLGIRYLIWDHQVPDLDRRLWTRVRSTGRPAMRSTS